MAGRTLGVLLTIAGLAVLVGAPASLPPWAHLFAGIALLVPGTLLALGLMGASRRVRTARRSPRLDRPHPPRPPADTTVHRYSVSRGAWIILALLAAPFGALGLLVGVATLNTTGSDRWYGLLVGAGLAAVAAWLGVYPWYRRGIRIEAGPSGLVRRTPLRRTRLAWNEIVALSTTSLVVAGVPSGRVYRVWSRTRDIAFQDAIGDSQRLAERIARATGLDWEPG
jgi:hypothetical protein